MSGSRSSRARSARGQRLGPRGVADAERLRDAGIERGRRPRRRERARRTPRSSARPRSRPTTPSARSRASAAWPSCTAPTCSARSPRCGRCIAVAGTHGKTTTSSMVVHALRGCGLDPGYLVGGDVRSTGPNAGWGAGEWLVVEADESDRSLLELASRRRRPHERRARPPRHLRLAPRGRRDVPRVPRARARRRSSCGTGPELRALAAGAGGADVDRLRRPEPALDADGSRFALARASTVQLARPRRAQRAQRRAALEAARLAGADPAQAAAALAGLPAAPAGASSCSATTATGAASTTTTPTTRPRSRRRSRPRARSAPARVVAVFQPHLYSRTRALAREFGAALAAADVVVVLDVYPARERAEDFPGVDGQLVAEAAADAAAGRTVALAARLRRRRAVPARRRCAPATSASRWAPATSTRSAREAGARR